MRKGSVFIILTLVVFTMFALPIVASAAQSKITVAVNGKLVSFPDQQPYIDGNGRTLVPVRFPAEVLGASVGWEENTSTVTIDQKGDSYLPKSNIVLRIGQKNVAVNGATKTMDTTAIVTNGRTMVPIRFISEYLGAKVEWCSDSQTVHVFTKGQTAEEIAAIEKAIAEELKGQVPTVGEKFGTLSKADEAKLLSISITERISLGGIKKEAAAGYGKVNDDKYNWPDGVKDRAQWAYDYMTARVPTLASNETFYSSSSLVYIDIFNDYNVRGLLVVKNANGSVSKKVADLYAEFDDVNNKWGSVNLYIYENSVIPWTD